MAQLVAREVSPADVFEAVAEEVAGALEVPMISIVRYGAGATATQVGAWGAQNPFPVGISWQLDGTGVAAMVSSTGQPARVRDYADVPGEIAATLVQSAGIRCAVGVPIIVERRPWGVMMAMACGPPLPRDTEERLAGFTELVATALANAQARNDLHVLLEEQSALRRVATAVASAAAPAEIFDLVCRETGALIGADTVNLAHFTPDGVNVTMAGWSNRGVHMRAGTRLALDGDSINALVWRTRAPGRFDSYDGTPGQLAQRLRELGIRSEVGAPIVVAGKVWGVLIAGTDQMSPLPAETESRLARLAELVGTAIANAADRHELIASRTRIVAAADEARRRLARDLHDGAQQRLVNVVMSLQLAEQRRDTDAAAARRLVVQALDNARDGLAELRELAAGVHPAILTSRGLRAATGGLADRCGVPVIIEVPDVRYPPLLEAAAYFIIAEALTNIDKHAEASAVEVRIHEDEDTLVLEVADNGKGGASFAGSGLLGLRDRVEALGGTLVLDSTPGLGTQLKATMRLAASP